MQVPTVIIAVAGGLVVVLAIALRVGRRRRRAAAQLPGRPRLEITSGPLAGQVIELSARETAIGSVAGNEVLLADPAVSRQHARLVRRGKRFEVHDLASTNGVYVNGRRRPRRTLAPGDVLRIGNSELVFRIE